MLAGVDVIVTPVDTVVMLSLFGNFAAVLVVVAEVVDADAVVCIIWLGVVVISFEEAECLGVVLGLLSNHPVYCFVLGVLLTKVVVFCFVGVVADGVTVKVDGKVVTVDAKVVVGGILFAVESIVPVDGVVVSVDGTGFVVVCIIFVVGTMSLMLIVSGLVDIADTVVFVVDSVVGLILTVSEEAGGSIGVVLSLWSNQPVYCLAFVVFIGNTVVVEVVLGGVPVCVEVIVIAGLVSVLNEVLMMFFVRFVGVNVAAIESVLTSDLVIFSWKNQFDLSVVVMPIVVSISECVVALVISLSVLFTIEFAVSCFIFGEEGGCVR